MPGYIQWPAKVLTPPEPLHTPPRHDHKQIHFVGIPRERPTKSGKQLRSRKKMRHDLIFYLKMKNWKVQCAEVSSLSPYLEEPSFAAVTAVSLLGFVSTSFAQLETEISAHSFLQNSSGSVRLDGQRLWTALFRSYHRLLIGFRTLSLSNTGIGLVWNHSVLYV